MVDAVIVPIVGAAVVIVTVLTALYRRAPAAVDITERRRVRPPAERRAS
ncbi:MAG TPA: hypothetical protein VEA38_15660 [Terriglobales bacterium]|nr:hypothetical protein [Terriglobales bacterium]